ncbi:hypothetical protein BZM27_39810 [Paraburkholderia steynii]|uniref:Fis family transcriptional regulator n=1 Tax=Paraburkholderia steynii TaxID=1245441 RepID=A0A4R0X3X5_9BURK|nr:hypothetical protein BZM27_39810 [Paraburkholderia steynii]
MSSKRRKGRATSPRRPLTKAMLLPMDRASARKQSLALHLALAACRTGRGNSHLFNELMEAVCVAWFLQQDGYGDEPLPLFKLAEDAVEVALQLGQATGEYLLAEDAVPAFEKLLALHDAQMNVAPLHKVADADSRLRRVLLSTASSPIPDDHQNGQPSLN